MPISKTIEDDTWDGQYMHYGLSAGQSAQSAEIACGIKLSTWPDHRNANSKYIGKIQDWSAKVGYSWDCDGVDCPKCKEWINEHCRSCRGCGTKCTYGTCKACVEKEIISLGGLEAWKRTVVEKNGQ